MIVCKAETGIESRQGAVVAVAKCMVYAQGKPTGESVDVANLGSEVKAGAWIACQLCNGVYVVVWEDC